MNPTDAPSRYRLFKKGAYGTFYIEDVLSRRQTSLKTKDKKEAERLYQAHCECAEAPDRAYRVGMAYVGSIDPDAATRTWKQVVEAYAANHPKGSPTRYRIEIAGKDRAIACLLRLPLLRVNFILAKRGQEDPESPHRTDAFPGSGKRKRAPDRSEAPSQEARYYFCG